MKIVYLFSSLLILSSFTSFGQNQNPKELPPGYYVVVAAFSPDKESYAERLKGRLLKKGLSPDYGFNTRRNYYYVYLSKFQDLTTSVQEMRRTRKNPEFPDAWVRIVTDKLEMLDATAAQVVSVPDTQKDTTNVQEDSPVDDKTPENAEADKVAESQIQKTEVSTSGEVKVDSVVAATSYEDIRDNPEIIQPEKITLANTEVFLSLFNARNNRVVEGMVKVVDTERAKLIKEVKGNDYLYLPDPRNKTKQISLICEAFGYKMVQHEMNYANPLADTVKDYVDLIGTTLVVYFDLIRYQSGDKGTLYHVYFYNDAGIMLPESKFELTSLLDMMNENPNYRVRLHGHTNGNYHGKIISMGPEKNFFSLEGSRNTVGSAKDLSRERAEVIKEYLVSNGVAESRIEIKAWGGKKPIYDRHGSNAKKNVRVEVEILSD